MSVQRHPEARDAAFGGLAEERGAASRVLGAQVDQLVRVEIADARIEYIGAGDVADTAKQGWFKRTLNVLSPS